MPQLRVALAQIDITVGDLDGNRERVMHWTSEAAAAGAHLVVFPEMCLTGYPPEDLVLRGSFTRASQAALHRLAAQLNTAGLGDIAVVVGYLDTADEPVARVGRPAGEPENACALLHRGRIVTRYAKHHLPNYGVFDEFRYFVPGDRFPVVQLHGVDIAFTICEDLWQDGGPIAVAARAGVGLVLCINGSPYERGKSHARDALAARRAREAGAALAYVNMVGGQDELVFDGDSLIVGADGALLARARQFEEMLLVSDLELPASCSTFTGGVDASDATTMRVERLTVSPEPLPAYKAIPNEIAEQLDPDAELYAAVVVGTRDYVRKNGFRSIALGLSGGIDSALVATVAVDALGADAVHTVAMPSAYSSEHSVTDAGDLAARQHTHHQVLAIAPMVDAYQAALALSGLAEENLQARVRGTALMALSNQDGHLILTTGNKSELATGFSTLYGDSAGGYAPIKDVPKTLVWQLCRWRNAVAAAADEPEPIPVAIIDKPPVRRARARAAGLRPAAGLHPARRGDRRLRGARPRPRRVGRLRLRRRHRRARDPPGRPRRVQAAAVPAGPEGDRQGVRARPPAAHHVSLAGADRRACPRAVAGRRPPSRLTSDSSDAVGLRSSRDRSRDGRSDPVIEDAGDHTVSAQLIVIDDRGQRLCCGQLHALGDARGAHLEGSAKDAGEGEHIVDLVGVVGAAGGHHRGVLGSDGRVDLRVGIGHREDHRVRRHAGDRALGDLAGRQAEEDVGAGEGVFDVAGEAGLVADAGELGLDRGEVGARAVHHSPAVGRGEVADAGREQDLAHRDPGGACTGHDDTQIGERASGDLGRIRKRGEHDDRGAVLVVVEDRDVQRVLQPLLQLEAARRGDVFEVDAAEARGEPHDRLEQLVDIRAVQADRHRVDIGKVLEQQRLALHDRHRAERADVTEAEDGGAVTHDRHGVGAPGVDVGELRVVGDRGADPRDARRVGQRQVIAVSQRRGDAELDLSPAVQRECRVGVEYGSSDGRRNRGVRMRVGVGGPNRLTPPGLTQSCFFLRGTRGRWDRRR